MNSPYPHPWNWLNFPVNNPLPHLQEMWEQPGVCEERADTLHRLMQGGDNVWRGRGAAGAPGRVSDVQRHRARL